MSAVPRLVLAVRAEQSPGPEQLPTWRTDAACRGMDTDLFFPPRGGDGWRAKRVCARCPVRAECLDEHLGETVGVFGGLSPKERIAERRRRRVAS